jgi:hypothetical protein
MVKCPFCDKSMEKQSTLDLGYTMRKEHIDTVLKLSWNCAECSVYVYRTVTVRTDIP